MEDQNNTSSLSSALESALPLTKLFSIYHISSPPTRCDPIYSPPPNAKPERTFRESHFLQIAIPVASSQVFILAVEVLIYTTRHLTTLFVSKADSTGYHHLLELAKEHESPLRTIASTFIAWLVQHRLREGTKLVVDLFARASDQYLYPGSSDNARKHISSDRQLVKWWTRVLQPVVEKYREKEEETSARAYLLVPGEDSIASFLSPTARTYWTHGHPLATLSRQLGAPPRCLIPHFPDDPKGRYLIELDDELPSATNEGSIEASPSKKRGNGAWRSVKSIDQFWEMMAFRSECSSGRCVGFFWIVLEPPTSETPVLESQESQLSVMTSFSEDKEPESPTRDRTPARKSKSSLRGPIPSLKPRILRNTSSLSNIPEETVWYTWPTSSRGTIVLPDAAYEKASELLRRLVFDDLALAVQSTKAWVGELAVLGGVDQDWGIDITGKKVGRVVNGDSGSGAVNMLGVKRPGAAAVNVLQVKRAKKITPTPVADP